MPSTEFNCSFQAEKDLIPDGQAFENGLELTITAPGAAHQQRFNMNLALVIDCSGSMTGAKIEYARQAASYVITLLDERDRVHIIAFDDQVSPIGAAEAISENERRRLTHLIGMLQPGGLTNLSGGWLEGCDRIASAEGYGINRALLLTDGQANVGITDIEALGMHARQLHQHGVSTSTFGIGEDYQEHLLEQMANLGGGNFYYIDSPRTISDAFAQEMKDILTVTARAIEVILPIPPGVTLKVIGGWKHEVKNNELILSLGDLSSDKNRIVHIQAILPPGKEGTQIVFPATVRALDQANQLLERQVSLTLGYASAAAAEKAPRNREVAERYASALVSEAANEALKLEREGLRREAAESLQQVMESRVSHLSREFINEKEMLSRRLQHGLSERERKEEHLRAYLEKQSRRQKP